MEPDYSTPLQVFIELRARGISLSAVDSDILLSWQRGAVPPDLITETMLEISQECVKKNRLFPSTLKLIDKRVRKNFQRLHEY